MKDFTNREVQVPVSDIIKLHIEDFVEIGDPSAGQGTNIPPTHILICKTKCSVGCLSDAG